MRNNSLLHVVQIASFLIGDGFSVDKKDRKYFSFNLEAEFVLPPSVNPLVEDLLKRMIQRNPLRRIQIREIKLHPWLRKTSPLYSSCSALIPISEVKIDNFDEQLIDEICTYSMNSLRNNHDKDRIKRILRAKLDASFVTAYELLKDSKEKGERMLKCKT